MTDTEQRSALPTSEINRAAPLVAEAAIEIDAPPARVWETLIDVERWSHAVPDPEGRS